MMYEVTTCRLSGEMRATSALRALKRKANALAGREYDKPKKKWPPISVGLNREKIKPAYGKRDEFFHSASAIGMRATFECHSAS